MTNFRRWNKAQTEDPKLLTIIKRDLQESLTCLKDAVTNLKIAEELLKKAAVVPGDYSANLGGIPRAKFDTHSAIKHANTRIEELEKENLDDYAKTVAGFMTETEVRNKFREYE
jgi:hypothetical protein